MFDIQFWGIDRHRCQEYAHLSFLCGRCNRIFTYSLTNTDGQIVAVWSDIKDDL